MKVAYFPLHGLQTVVPDDATCASLYLFDSTEPTETVYFDDDHDDTLGRALKAATMPEMPK